VNTDFAAYVAKYRGFNLVILDPIKCTGIAIKPFDTYGDNSANNDLIANLANIPKGTAILGVISDEATYVLSAEAKNALKAIGVDLPGLSLRSKAFFYTIKGSTDKHVVREMAPGGDSLAFDYSFVN